MTARMNTALDRAAHCDMGSRVRSQPVESCIRRPPGTVPRVGRGARAAPWPRSSSCSSESLAACGGGGWRIRPGPRRSRVRSFHLLASLDAALELGRAHNLHVVIEGVQVKPCLQLWRAPYLGELHIGTGLVM